MDQYMDQFTQAQIVRETQFTADLQMLRTELAMNKNLYEEEKGKSTMLYDQLAQIKLELSTALAASQIRVEQLTNQLQDNRIELFELRSDKTKMRSQLDAVREEYLNMQRNSQQLQSEHNALKTEYNLLQLKTKTQLDTFRQAVNGASSILSREADYGAVVDALVGTEQSGGSKLDFVLAKLASTAREADLLRKENQAFTEKQNLQEKRIQRYEETINKTTKQIGSPSIQLLYDELQHQQEVIQNQDKQISNLLKQADEIKLINNRQTTQIKQLTQNLNTYKNNMKEVGELRKIVRQMIQNEVI